MFQLTHHYWSMISSLLHLVGLRLRVYYTLTNFRGVGMQVPLDPLKTPTPRIVVLVGGGGQTKKGILSRRKRKRPQHEKKIAAKEVPYGEKPSPQQNPYTIFLKYHKTWGGGVDKRRLFPHVKPWGIHIPSSLCDFCHCR